MEIIVTKMEMKDGKLVMTLAEPLPVSKADAAIPAESDEHTLHLAIERCRSTKGLDAIADEAKALSSSGRLTESAYKRVGEAWEARNTFLEGMADLRGMQ